MNKLLVIFFVVFTSTLYSQIIIDSYYLSELEKLESQYMEENEVSLGTELIKQCNEKHSKLKMAFEEKGLVLDLGNIDKIALRSNPNLKLAFKDYKKSLKLKLKHFYSDEFEAFKKVLKLTYPDWKF